MSPKFKRTLQIQMSEIYVPSVETMLNRLLTLADSTLTHLNHYDWSIAISCRCLSLIVFLQTNPDSDIYFTKLYALEQILEPLPETFSKHEHRIWARATYDFKNRVKLERFRQAQLEPRKKRSISKRRMDSVLSGEEEDGEASSSRRQRIRQFFTRKKN